MMKRAVISWDGKHLPRGLKWLPPGRYALEPVEADHPLSPEEDRGIIEALKQLDAGQGKSLAEVIAGIRRRRGPA